MRTPEPNNPIKNFFLRVRETTLTFGELGGNIGLLLGLKAADKVPEPLRPAAVAIPEFGLGVPLAVIGALGGLAIGIATAPFGKHFSSRVPI